MGLLLLQGSAALNPRELFASGEQGLWLDPSDFSTMWQDSAKTTPVTAAGDPVGYISDKSGRGNDAFQTTSASRPTLQTTGGLWYLSFDGSDDSLVTNAVDFTATDEMTVIAGVRKLTDSSYPMIVESSVNWSANNGSFSLSGNLNNGYAWSSRGTGGSTVLTTDYLAPVTTVLGLQSHIAGPSLGLRANGSLVSTSSATQGLGNYGNWPIYIGRRAGSTLPFTGHIYQLIVRGKTTPTGKLLEAERFVGRKTGVSF